MARSDIISKLYAKKGTALDFNYDALTAPPLASLIPYKDLEYMNKLVTSIKYNSKTDYKESEIKKVMNCYGFVRYTSGTHRVVYRHLDIPTIVAKISLNKSSLGDSIREYHNQFMLKPFCTKVFDVYPTGLIGIFERVEPFQSRDEFMSVAGDIFDFINSKIVGKYVVDDIGTASFMNYGIRKVGPYSNISFGPVILDFPEVYPLDGDKLYCNKIDNGIICGGVLDYDSGFNTIRCTRCGKIYEARELQKAIENNEVVKKGETKNMSIVISRGSRVIKTVDSNRMGTNTIKPPKSKNKPVSSDPMDMVGNAQGRKAKTANHMINMGLIHYNESNTESTEDDHNGGFVRIHAKKETPKEEVQTPVVEPVTPVAEEHSEPVEVEHQEPEVEHVYSTETGFIPPAEESVNPEEEIGSESAEPVEPENEIGETEQVEASEEIGDAPAYVVDPAAIAASMMAGRDNDPVAQAVSKNPFAK